MKPLTPFSKGKTDPFPLSPPISTLKPLGFYTGCHPNQAHSWKRLPPGSPSSTPGPHQRRPFPFLSRMPPAPVPGVPPPPALTASGFPTWRYAGWFQWLPLRPWAKNIWRYQRPGGIFCRCHTVLRRRCQLPLLLLLLFVLAEGLGQSEEATAWSRLAILGPLNRAHLSAVPLCAWRAAFEHELATLYRKLWEYMEIWTPQKNWFKCVNFDYFNHKLSRCQQCLKKDNCSHGGKTVVQGDRLYLTVSLQKVSLY